MQSLFRDRHQAGRLLAERVSSSVRGEDVLVLGLARGGVPVAYELARALGAPLDVFVLRKLEAPGRGELTIGAIAAGGVRVLDSATIAALEIPQAKVEDGARREAIELARLERYYRNRHPAPKMMGRTIVLVDDGLSSPFVLRSATEALSAYRPARILLAVPALGVEARAALRTRAGEIVSALPADAVRAESPDGTPSASSLYEDESSISDRDVRNLLSRAGTREHHHQLTG